VKVLLVHNRYRQPGGEERHVDLLAASLREAGAEVSRLELDSESLASRASRVRAAAGLVYDSRSYRLVRSEARRIGADVAHFHNLWPLLTPAALRGARDAGARVVLTTHNYRFACPNGTLLRNGETHDDCLEGSSLGCGLRSLRSGGVKVAAYGAALAAQRRLGLLDRWVDAFVVPSRFVGEALVRAGHDQRRVHLIRYGIPQGAAPAAGDRRHLLFVGRLSPEKGVDVLVRASSLAPEVPVVVAGAGPLAGAAESAGSLTLVGHTDQARLAELRSGAVGSLVPSVCFDVSPFTILESAAAGRPVVGSRIGGVPELIEHELNGLLVAPGDPVELAEAYLAALKWADDAGRWVG
jgi:glycosyltransferase involved in cell wall biosynthesis